MPRENNQGEKQVQPAGTGSRPGLGNGTPGISLRARFFLLTLTFSAAVLLLVGVSYLGLQALSGARAYVHGESQWTKAQKHSVIALMDYALSGDEEALTRHRQSLQVIFGDRRARETLDSASPDLDTARQGFLAGRNHPDDIETMIRLFRHARGLAVFDRAVEIWERGDEVIDQLIVTADELESVVHQHGPGSAAVREQLQSILKLDQELTELEDQFSAQIGLMSHQLVTNLSIAILLTALLLILSGTLTTYRVFSSIDRAGRDLRASEKRYRALVDQPEVGMWQLDDDGRVQYFNPAMRSLLEIEPDVDVTRLEMDRFIIDEDRASVHRDREARSRGQRTTREVTLITGSGEQRQVLVHGAPIVLDDGTMHGHVGTALDITQRKAAEARLRHQAFHDPLTGLPNRHLFMDRLQMTLRRARREGGRVAVLFVDLDRFKVVNDSVGHTSGDQLLRQAAQRLDQAVRERDTIARFGGDEFGLIIENIETENNVIKPADRIVKAFSETFHFRGLTARIGTSVGITLSDGHALPVDLLRQADIAMYVAKRKGGSTWHIFDPEHDAEQQHRLQLENDLWSAAERDELVLHYQPIVHLESSRTVALEALVRWQHPERGLLMPPQFIPFAEETGAISGIGKWVTERACIDLVHLQHELGKLAPQAVAVNISAAEFRFGRPEQRIRAALRQSGLEPGKLQLEVTESLLTENPEAIRILERQGHPVAIDDFGTGYASLDLLREVRFSTIKIDRGFVHGLLTREADRAVIESILHLADKLDMEVIAEGIENQEQLECLRTLGCKLGQGFLFAPARPLDELLISDIFKPA